jgi:hypothetical protein
MTMADWLTIASLGIIALATLLWCVRFINTL